MQILRRAVLLDYQNQSNRELIKEAMPALLNWAYENNCCSVAFKVSGEILGEGNTMYKGVECKIEIGETHGTD